MKVLNTSGKIKSCQPRLACRKLMQSSYIMYMVTKATKLPYFPNISIQMYSVSHLGALAISMSMLFP